MVSEGERQGRWAGRHNQKDVVRGEVWDRLETDWRQRRPGLEQHPEFRGRRHRSQAPIGTPRLAGARRS